MKLLTVKQTTVRFPAFTEGGLRHLLFYRKENGINSAVIKVGRRIYFEEDAFEKWLDSNREK